LYESFDEKNILSSESTDEFIREVVEGAAHRG